MAKKNNKAQQDRRRNEKRARRAHRKRDDRGEMSTSFNEDLRIIFEDEPVVEPKPMTLTPPRPERLLPPVLVGPGGHPVPDPYAILGLRAGETDEATVRAAYRERLQDRPPEQHPEEARQLREARDRLLDPERLLERALGELRAPDPLAWGLTEDPTPSGPARLSADARLLGQALLYALVEDALRPPPEPAPQKDPASTKKPVQGRLF